jgi:hypothetical protein
MSLAHRPPLPRLVRRVRGTLGSGYDGYRPLLHLVDRPVGPQPLDEREDLARHRTVPLGPQARRVTVGVLHRSGRVAGRLQRLHETKRRRGGAGVALRQATPPGYRRRPVRRGFGPDRQALQGAPRGAASRSRSNSGHRSNSARPETYNPSRKAHDRGSPPCSPGPSREPLEGPEVHLNQLGVQPKLAGRASRERSRDPSPAPSPSPARPRPLPRRPPRNSDQPLRKVSSLH